MKKYLKNYLTGFFIGLGLLSTALIGFVILKARQSTNPGIADDGQGLYTSVGGTLTAGKWNSLVQRSSWVDVPTSDTANFDITCERRFKSVGGDGCEANIIWQFDYVSLSKIRTPRSTGNRYIDNTAKNYLVNLANPASKCAISKLQKKCAN